MMKALSVLWVLLWSASALAGSYDDITLKFEWGTASMPCHIGSLDIPDEELQELEDCTRAMTALLEKLKPSIQAMFTHYAKGEHPFGLFRGALNLHKNASGSEEPVLKEEIRPLRLRFVVSDPDDGFGASELNLRFSLNRNLSAAQREKMTHDFLVSQRYSKASAVRKLLEAHWRRYHTTDETVLRKWVENKIELRDASWLVLFTSPSWLAKLKALSDKEPRSAFGILARILWEKPMGTNEVTRLVSYIAQLDAESRVSVARFMVFYLHESEWVRGTKLIKGVVPELSEWLDGFATP